MPKVTYNENNRQQCVCSACPSYNSCAKSQQESLFCGMPLNQRSCKYEENGCICGDCQIYKNNKLEAGYYCVYGSADETK
jgi:hypothetical protein